uniref:Uncharacterized protein At4g26480 family n=1 Tax=Cajanus cajan TaxID=3821 RepID=A0A151TEU2_CAJCA|nr:Uncharacterized protein At4g26480 family [Cajanus cajan]
MEEEITSYDSSQRILLVGEGDFSFSLCLARAFGTGVNITATSMISIRHARQVNQNAIRNLSELDALGCTLVFKVNVYTMIRHPLLKNKTFDRIIYNFPHSSLIDVKYEQEFRLHKVLVSGFLKNAKGMLKHDGEIQITHKTTYPFTLWNITGLATSEGLSLVGKEKFDKKLYPGYDIKRGAGPQCDETFHVGESSTFMFANLYKDVMEKNKKKTFKDVLLNENMFLN